jgi:hypothetical protein
MKRRDFFTKLMKGAAVAVVAPSILKDSEVEAKEVAYEPENTSKTLKYTGSFMSHSSGGMDTPAAAWLYEHQIDKAVFGL